jgi:hypothetical protein
MLLQETIEFFSAAIKRIDGVISAKLFNFRSQRPSLGVEETGALSKKPGSANRRRI